MTESSLGFNNQQMVINKKTGATPASLRKTHRGLILSRIQAEPGISRADLARSHGFSEMAATRIVRELLAAGIVEEFDIADQNSGKKHVGRPKTGLRIVPESLFAAGITVSAYHSEVSICDANGQLVASKRLEDVSFHILADVARTYATALRDLIDDSGIGMDRIVGVGVALSARTSPAQGEIVTSEYFGWENDEGEFCREIRRIINLPVEIENIANALAIAEMRFGVARGASEFSLIHAATFLGASIVSESRPVRGVSGVSGLMGHFGAEQRPLTCVCGRDDCLNLSATGFGLLSETGRLDHRVFDTSRLSFYATSLLTLLEDEGVTALIAGAGARLAPAIDSVAKLLGPKMIVMSGHLGANDAYFDGAVTALSSNFDYTPSSRFKLVKGTISSAKSASLLALHAFCYSDRLDYERFAEQGEQTGGAAYG